MSDDDEDTVVGNCLHCNAPPPPRSKSRGGSTSYSNSQPCPSTSTAMVSSTGTTPSAATRVQVSCDDCRSFICDGCHWCHEFQANHEIRVCDRCDAFYCRGCDEMDQCEDCSEVVCNTCSTLMSCKFCGCGLCEDCATACGRCGIVLCARDAKFAVECDTCRMSYCLVCLASGTKDPCVRCGHRPSKRVEQLVHLRLKSIYKAFKQSGASMGPGGKGGAIKGGDSSAMGGKYSSALRSLTDGNSDSGGGGGKDTFTNFDQSMASEVAAVLQSASNSMANSDGVDGDGRRRGKRASSDGHHMPNSGGARNNRATNRASNAAAERYFRKTQEEMQAAAAAAESEAEAAAAALLAELDEAEKITGSKKKKKKKKKKGKKDAIVEEDVELSEQNPTTTADNVKKSADDMDDSTSVSQKKKGGKKGSKDSLVAADEDSSDEEMDFAQLVAGAKGSSGPSKKDKKEELSEEKEVVPPPPPPPPPEPKQPEPTKSDDSKVETTTATVDFDAELAVLLSNDDEEGLETFLANLKGVPGLGPARKTAKKALKKIRENKKPAAAPPQEPETMVTVQTHTKPRSETTTKKPKKEKKKKQTVSLKERAQAAAAEAKARAALDPNPQPVSTAPPPLLVIVSRTNLDSTSSKKGVAECVMQMSPKVVGWVIGKGGSRIKDMMEESGAKIWIDQESMEETQARVVYVSGRRTSVQQAVQRIKEMVLEAPISVTAGADPGDAILSSDAPQNLSVSSLTAIPAAVPASTVAQNPPMVAVKKKEPTSFAAAAGASSSTPTVTNPGSPPKQQQLPPTVPPPQQSWALPPMVEANVAAPSISSPPPVVAEAPKPLTGIITTVLGCDPRFVALLIGRRGWTVKNIQTESGANLDIDQTVDPPKIIISGQVENVQRAEQMVRDVLKYPHAQLNQEAQQQQAMDNIANQRFPDQHMATTNQSPMPMPGLRRDVSHDSPGSMNFPPGYAQYQQQQQQQQSPGTMGLFPESAQARISEFLPNDQRSPPAASPRGHQQQDWGGHQQNQQVQRNQFSVSLPPFSGSQGQQLNSSPRDQQYNSNAPFNHHSPSPHGGNRRPSTYTLPTEQHLHFSPQSHDAAPQAAQMQQAHHAPGSRMNDFVGSSTGNSNRTMNGGWDQPSNNGNSIGGGGWSQSQQLTPDLNQLSGYQGQAPSSRSLLSENPFQQMQQNRPPSAPAPSQSTNPGVSDDSIMVDNLFSSIGAAGKGTEGLLTALGSISLLGGPTPPEPQPQQQMEDWERAFQLK